MRASTLLNAVLELPGVRVSKAAVVGGEVRVTVRLRRRRLGCPRCRFSTRHRYDTRDVDRRGGIWTWLAGFAGSSCGAGRFAARSTACGPRGCRSPGTGPATPATSRTWWRGSSPRPTRPRSPASPGPRGAPSARSANGRGRRARPGPAVRAGRHRCRRDLLAQAPPYLTWCPTTTPARSSG